MYRVQIVWHILGKLFPSFLCCVLAAGCQAGLRVSETGAQGIASSSNIQDDPLAPGSLLETVTIAGTTYTVPKPWFGRRIAKDDSNSPAPLVMIPRELAFKQSAIYVIPPTRDAYVRMAEAALEDGVELQVDSGYRSVRYQRIIFDRLLQQGRDFYDLVRWIAPPGYSEHMLGATLDFVPSNYLFYDSEAYRWLEKNGERFGFFQTLPRNSPDGLPWESWHWQYRGESR